MPESPLHNQLVRNLREWVESNLEGVEMPFVYSDNGSPEDRPPNILGHVPDLFYENPVEDMIIIGEAKTPRDIETRRSVRQLRAYLKYASKAQKSHLIVAVPWYVSRTAAAVLRGISRRDNISTVSVIIIPKLRG